MTSAFNRPLIVSANALAMVLGPKADHGSIKAVADAAHGRFDAGIRQPFSVFDRQILAALVAVVNEPHALGRAAFMHRLFAGIQNEPGMRGGADAPADDLARIPSMTKAT